ncbi:hypothetical protein [Rouxiella sp. Mn2063]|uniref:hypothetical protein n=1 Tax=Rouxiella sp. Mn2063 TaxID=3395262 RepID=UPI003BC165F1
MINLLRWAALLLLFSSAAKAEISLALLPTEPATVKSAEASVSKTVAAATPKAAASASKVDAIALKTLADGTGSFHFPVAQTKKTVEVFTYQPAGTDASAPLVMVIPGADRNAVTYRNDWIKVADQYHLRIVVPRLSEQDYPGSNGYMLGNLQDPKTHHRLPKSQWAFTVVNNIFDAMRKQGITTQSQYYLFGNNGGCQFVHRMLTLLPQPEVKAAICSAAGWWTLPATDQHWPYGLREAPIKVSSDQLAAYFAKPILIAVGANDDEPENKLQHSKQIAAQGNNRLERAENYFTASQQQAELNNMPFNWHFVALPDVGQNRSNMSVYAAGEFYRFEQQQAFNP